MIEEIRSFYSEERVSQVDPDFLQFEEDMASSEDVQLITELLSHTTTDGSKLPNPHNSCLLYVTQLTDDFDFTKGRADTVGGSPPDIDIDFDALERTKAINWVIDSWGREQVANIAAPGAFKPKSLTNMWFKVTEGNETLKREILRKFPPKRHGIEPTLKEILDGDKEKNYPENPDLKREPKYADWLFAAKKLENMTNKMGIHAAGIVISNEPIWERMPIWMKKDKELMPDGKKQEIVKWITQFDMGEVEELGLIKFDFLGIDNLSVIKRCCNLIYERHGVEIDIYSIPDGDDKAYKLLEQGWLTGIFQMETSTTARDLIAAIKPRNIEEISDISALNRPGPMESGLDKIYIQNKNHGYDTRNLPVEQANELKGTYWALVYQEQCMFIASNLAGFTLRRADDLRRAIGKKKAKLMAEFEEEFIEGVLTHSELTKSQAEDIWEELVKFAGYGFNKSHSVAYSVITYICAYLKANYPIEFFTALMSVRSNTLQPKDWASKAPSYVREARQMGIDILPPSVNTSRVGFTIEDDKIYFGLEAIKSIGKTAAISIVRARGKQKFKDILDFVNRVNTQKVTSKVFEALSVAGAFDRMGYSRGDLKTHAKDVYAYVRGYQEYLDRAAEIPIRTKEYEEKTRLLEEKEEIKKQILACDRILRYKKYSDEEKEQAQIERDELDVKLQAYEEMDLKRKPIPKPKDKPEFPDIARSKRVEVDLVQLIEQAEYIGCYIEAHPADILYPDAIKVVNVEEASICRIAGVVTKYKQIITRFGKPMAFVEIGDGSGVADITCFTNVLDKLEEQKHKLVPGSIIRVYGEIEEVDPIVKMKAFGIDVYTGEGEQE